MIMLEQLLRDLSIVIQLIFLEGILSVDNAMVLASLVAHLPKNKPIPWPKKLEKLNSISSKWFSSQQTAALRVGLLGAYLGRGLMLLLASFIIENPWLRILGALYLLKLAIEHLGKVEGQESLSEETKLPKSNIAKGGFWKTVLVVELSDLAFSIDNVVASVAISRKLIVVFLGVAIGILLMRVAAGWFIELIEKEPILIEASYLLILNIGLELIIEDIIQINIDPLIKLMISLTTILLCLIYAHNSWLHKTTKPLWLKIGSMFGKVSKWLTLTNYKSSLNS